MPTFESDYIPSLVVIGAWFALLRALRFSGYGIAFLSLAGTSLHELAHYLVGLVLGAKPEAVNLFPRRREDRWVLGSVSFANLNIWNSAFVAFAPLLLVGVSLLVFEFWMYPAYLGAHYLSWCAAGYVAACALFACVPSSTDIKVGALSALMYGAVGYGLWYAAH